MKITTQAQFDEVKAQAAAINSRGSRFRELESRALGYGDELNNEERAEWESMLADYAEKCRAMEDFNKPAMARVLGSLA